MLGVKLLILMRHWAKEELEMFCLLQCLEAGRSAVQSKHWAKMKFKKKRKKEKPLCFETQKNSIASSLQISRQCQELSQGRAQLSSP